MEYETTEARGAPLPVEPEVDNAPASAVALESETSEAFPSPPMASEASEVPLLAPVEPEAIDLPTPAPVEIEAVESRPSPLPQIILVLLVGLISLAVLKTYVIDNPVIGGINRDGTTALPAFEPTRVQTGLGAKNPPSALPSGQAAALPPPANAGAAKVAQPPASKAALPPAAGAQPSAAGKAALAATPVAATQGSDPEGARVAANAGNEAVQRGDLDAAIAQFTKAIELDPVGVYFGLRGSTYWRRQKFDLALADYDRAVALDPRNADNYFGRARVYKDMGKSEQARQDLQVFLDLKPNTPAEAGIRQDAQQMLNDLR